MTVRKSSVAIALVVLVAMSSSRAVVSAAPQAEPGEQTEQPIAAQAAGKSDEHPNEKLSQALLEAAAALSKSADKLSKAADGLDKKEKPVAQLGTVLPWIGATLDFTGKEKKARAKYSQDIEAIDLSIEAVAPLDEETRRADFLDTKTSAPAFSLDITVERSRDRKYLVEYATSREAWESNALCKKFNEKDRGRLCVGIDYETWKKENPREVEAVKAEWREAEARDTERRKAGALNALGISGPAKADYSYGIQARLAFDRLEVYEDDLAGDTTNVRTTQLGLAVLGRWNPRQDLALTARLGVERRNTAEVDKARRCQDLPSTDDGISGQACEDILFLTDDPEPKVTGFGELAATFVPLLFERKVVPGAEVRAGIDKVGDGARLRWSAVGFVTPVTSPVILRFGVGVEYVRALRAASDGSYRAGKDWWIPFLLTGAEF